MGYLMHEHKVFIAAKNEFPTLKSADFFTFFSLGGIDYLE